MKAAQPVYSGSIRDLQDRETTILDQSTLRHKQRGLRGYISFSRALIILGTGISFLFLSACDFTFLKRDNGEEKIARVNDKYLYRSDLNDATDGLNKDDSAIVAKRHIDKWIKEQLMLHRAELALSDEQKDFDKQIEEYRKSLLIYSYRQKLLQQKIDTLISSGEVEAYYENNINNFVLSDNVLKGTFVKLSINAPRLNEVRVWSRSNSPEDMDEFEKYCINYAEKYSNFNDTWIYFNSIKNQIPIQISQPNRYLRYNRNIERSDSLYIYLLHISDHKPEGDIAPLELVSEDIKSILLNKRKIEFFNDLESSVYNDGVSRNQFEIY